MKWGLIGGLVLLVAAFVAAAAESAVRVRTGDFGFVTAADLFATMLPNAFFAFKALVQEQVHPLVWNPILTSILTLPGWAILGVPGGILAWHNRPHRAVDIAEDDDVPYSSYEDILAAAEEALEASGKESDDDHPKYSRIAEFDPTEPTGDDSPEPLPEDLDVTRFLEPPGGKPDKDEKG